MLPPAFAPLRELRPASHVICIYPMNSFIAFPPRHLPFGVLSCDRIDVFHERRKLLFLFSVEDPGSDFAVAAALHAGIRNGVAVREEPGDFRNPCFWQFSLPWGESAREGVEEFP